MSTSTGGRVYSFGPFVLDTREGALLREGLPGDWRLFRVERGAC